MVASKASSYNFIERLGYGTFSEVFKLEKEEVFYAMKILNE
jgi:hypothetical protein